MPIQKISFPDGRKYFVKHNVKGFNLKLRQFQNDITKPVIKQMLPNEDDKTKNSAGITPKDFAHTACLMAVLNGPENMRDAMGAYNQIKNKFKDKTTHSGYDNKIAQHPFSFFRGTILAPYLNPLSEECPNQKIAIWLIKKDKTLWDTKFGEWIANKLKIGEVECPTNIKDIDSTPEFPRIISAKIPITNNSFKDIIARAMLRTPILSVLALIGIDTANIINKSFHGANWIEELKKSALTLGTTITATSVFGAIGAKHYGPVGSLTGAVLGSVTGKIAKKAVNSSTTAAS